MIAIADGIPVCLGCVMKCIFALIVAVAALVTSCARNSIWNGADLERWVHREAEKQGIVRDSIKVDPWYVKEGGQNIWHGRGIDRHTGAKREFAIPVDKVWTPSSER